LVYGSPALGEEEIAEVVATMRSGWIGTGPRVQQFQEDFRAYAGSPHAVALNSCTAALHLVMLAAGVGPGDEVITTPMTFCATANAIVHCGATPVFADCDRRTLNIDPEQIARKITPRTRAILPVHFAGRPCDMAAIMEIARQRGLIMIEDCAHAIGTRIGDRHVGTLGDFGCFSFYVTKNVTTGEGGMVVCRDPEAANRIKCLGLHGMSKDAWSRFGDQGLKHYDVVEAGYKYNMMDLQAAIGLCQLRKVERFWLRRQEIWRRYQESFADLPLATPLPPAAGTRHAYHLYTLILDIDKIGRSRDDVINALSRLNIGVGVHYRALHTHPFYAKTYGLRPGDFPEAQYVSERVLSIPLSPKLTDEDVGDVIDAVRRVVLD
jgi:dTDP-4-amino-4,6-dideoxygalactose transaminase